MKTKYFEFYSNGKLVKTVNRGISLSSKMLDIINNHSVDEIIVKREISTFEIQFIHFEKTENKFIGVDEGSYYYYALDMREYCRYGYRYELRLNNKHLRIKPIE